MNSRKIILKASSKVASIRRITNTFSRALSSSGASYDPKWSELVRKELKGKDPESLEKVSKADDMIY